jgi:hypothetical protein
MPDSARSLHVAPIDGRIAARLVRRLHYSGRVVQNSQVHFGVFWRGRLEGAMQWGPPMDRSKLLGLVAGTPWFGMLELNRMAFSERLPRNSESRALGVALRLLRRGYPQLQWVVSFADGTQCGDGTIYRASGWLLTKVGKNKTIYQTPDGKDTVNQVTVATCGGATRERLAQWCPAFAEGRDPSTAELRAAGFRTLEGYQLRYLYFLDPAARARLLVPVLPYAEIGRQGAGMYRGRRTIHAREAGDGGLQPHSGGAEPTRALHDAAAQAAA